MTENISSTVASPKIPTPSPRSKSKLGVNISNSQNPNSSLTIASFQDGLQATLKDCVNDVVMTPLQVIFLSLQKINEHHGGMVRQLIVDDKGLVLILVYGVMQVRYKYVCMFLYI